MNYMAIPGIPRHIKVVPMIKDKNYIIKQVCNYFDTDFSKLKRKSRERKYVQTRYILFYYLYNFTDMTYNEIAMLFKPAIADHTTAIYGVKLVRDQLSLKYDNDIKHHIKNITI